MLIKAPMLSLPVTAGEKLREAIYFFNRMIETHANMHLFPFRRIPGHHTNFLLPAIESGQLLCINSLKNPVKNRVGGYVEQSPFTTRNIMKKEEKGHVCQEAQNQEL